MHFSVRSRCPVTFNTELYATTVNNSFLSLTIFSHKELHLRWCMAGIEYCNTHKNSKRYQGAPHNLWSSETLGKYEKLILLDALKMHFQRYFELGFLHLISNGLNGGMEVISTH